MAATPADDLLAGYPVSEGIFDEGFGPDGRPRPAARAGLEAVARAHPEDLADRIGRSLQRAGVRFSSVEGDLQFYVDPVPRVITASDWEPVKRGLAQRVRALNAFVADAYGDQRIVAEGVVPREVIESADYFEPALRGPAGRRATSGSASPASTSSATATASGWCSRTTSARRAGSRTCTPRGARCSSTSPSRRTRRRARSTARSIFSPTPCAPSRPRRARGHRAPLAAVLTDGEHNSAYWEHAWLSRQLGIPLIEPRELEVRGDELWLLPRGLREPRRIDVVYRRTNADRLDSDLGRLLIGPVRAGRLGLVNQYGTGVADDKLTHAYVEQMIRFYVGEEPVLRSVPTYDLAQPEQLEEALDVFDELVLKPRAGHGGVGVLIAPHAEPRGHRGHPGRGDRRAQRLDRPAHGHALHASDRRRRRPARSSSYRPPSVRVPR